MTTRSASLIPDNMSNNEFVLALIEALQDPQVTASFDQAIDYNKIGKTVETEIGKHMKFMKDKLEEKDRQIHELETKCEHLMQNYDDLEQYSRKNSLRIDGVVEPPNENSTHDTVLSFCNDALKLSPPITIEDIDDGHRLRKKDDNASDKPRTMIVKFQSQRVRRQVYGARLKLKDVNKARAEARRVLAHSTTNAASADATPDAAPDDESHDDGDEQPLQSDADALAQKWKCAGPPIWISEDLSQQRARLAYDARDLKRRQKISDTWSYDCQIKIKTLENRIINIKRNADLDPYR